MRNIVGNKDNLLKQHGKMDISRCIGTIFSKAGDICLNIDDVNEASNSGALLVLANGKILDNYNIESEKRAKYKIVPTGLFLRDTKYPIFASFLKFEDEQIWRGAYFGTGEQLFVMYKQHYFDPVCFDTEYINIFCGPGVYTDIVGFGLKEILKNAKQNLSSSNTESDILCYTSNEDNVSSSLKDAIAKCLAEADSCDSSSKGKRAAKKATDKAKLLQQRLDKIEAKEKKKKQLEQKEEIGNTEREEINKISNIVENTVDEVGNIETESDKKCSTEYTGKNETCTEEIDTQQMCGNMNSSFVKELYSRLLYKESWMTKGMRRLDFYIKNIINLLEDERALSGNMQKGNGYLYSKNKLRCILNLGLIDIYGNDIYILDNTPNKSDFKTKDLELINSKVDLISTGFSQSELKDLPKSFDLSKFHKDCIFDADIEDFDFLDVVRLNHIIEERRYRFPDKFKDESCKIMCDKLKEAVELAVKISKTDCRYVIPKYDFLRKKIQFMIPFHLDNELQDVPELAIIVGKDKNIWNVHTIITMDDAIADARILFRTTSWLRSTV